MSKVGCKPTKEAVRHWLACQVHEHRAPPNPEQIRRELGWTMIEDERADRAQHETGADERAE